MKRNRETIIASYAIGCQPSTEFARGESGWFPQIDDPPRCVVCNRLIEYAIFRGVAHSNHHCPQSTESAKAAANTRLEEPIERNLPYGQRLSMGFDMLEESECDND